MKKLKNPLTWPDAHQKKGIKTSSFFLSVCYVISHK